METGYSCGVQAPAQAAGRFGGKRLLGVILALVGVAGSSSVLAANALTGIDYTAVSGNQVQVTLKLESPVDKPQAFTIENPARIALDLPETTNRLSERSLRIGVGAVEGVSTAEAAGRTRVVLRLAEMVPYDVNAEGREVRILLQAPRAQAAAQPSGGARPASLREVASRESAGGNTDAISEIDFRRGEDGTGRIVITLGDPSIPVDVREEGGNVVANLINARIPQRLERRLDVTDFATPVQTIDTRQRGNDVRMTIAGNGSFEHMAYQTGDTLVIELKPLTPEEKERIAKENFQFTGERLSLNFQDIEVRSVLQLIADFTGLNVVVSDSVNGNITLRLQNVPWDQALDIIMKARGLDKRQSGNVLMVGPAQEIAAREEAQLRSLQSVQELEQLRSEFIQVNYAKATDIAQLINSKDTSLLSSRGRVAIDGRTNTLIIQDTASNLTNIRNLVNRLDIPVRQVLIESRIVIATDDFSRDLGVRFGYSRNGSIGDAGAVVGGTMPGTTNYGGTTGFEVNAGSGNEGLIVDLPVNSPAASVGLAVGRIGSYLLQLELSAMETEGRGDIVSSPRVITANQTPATIEQGVEIPYREASASGATSISFKKAVLGLTVTPQITPDDRVMLDLRVSKDSRGEETIAGPAINTQAVTTQVLVDNGETVVLGGIYERLNNNGVRKVPLFGDLPLVGALFRSTTKIDNRSELLIFVTPKILKESLSASQ